MSNNEKLPFSKSTRTEIDTFLEKVSATPAVKRAESPGRLIFAMDATASRQPSWDHASHIQGDMFTETVGLGGLAIQLCYFRGFNEFHAFPWMTQSRDLLSVMSSVSCAGGHTQIGKVLQHTLQENKLNRVNALVYVGDCMEEDVNRLTIPAGELGLSGIPVFLFQEGTDQMARHAFMEIARLSKGAYSSFDSRSAQQLRDLLGAVAVYASGGHQALEAYSQRKGDTLQQLSSQIKKG